MSHSKVSGHFVEGAKGPIFVLLRQPPAAAAGCVLVAPPFAEEMNKCRRMVTMVALGLAAKGVATIVPDLYGTGDSGGDFADGEWSIWRADLASAAKWSMGVGHPVTGLLAIRLGCALAVDSFEAGELPSVAATVLWQPVFDGGRFLAQFLRLRIAASLMYERKESLAELKARLEVGERLEVAGYGLSSRLAASLESIRPPDQLPAGLGSVNWLEVVRQPMAQPQALSSKLIESSRGRSNSIDVQGVLGEPFWSSTEITVNEAMVNQTVSYLLGSVAGRGC